MARVYLTMVNSTIYYRIQLTSVLFEAVNYKITFTVLPIRASLSTSFAQFSKFNPILGSPSEIVFNISRGTMRWHIVPIS